MGLTVRSLLTGFWRMGSLATFFLRDFGFARVGFLAM